MSDTLFVCLMGMGTVFVGLICIIIVCKIVSGIIRLFEKAPSASADATPAPAAQPVSDEIPDKQRIIAAVSAAIAEELGTDVGALRILSFKKL
ncbi:MAG: OadG family protein [Acutalibacteraceae bacterium]|nr:OadG family protein [Acutalibacteraceae bacterium]